MDMQPILKVEEPILECDHEFIQINGDLSKLEFIEHSNKASDGPRDGA